MDNRAVRVLGMLLALQAEIEAMKVANTLREIAGHSPAYGEDAFLSVRERAEILAREV